jgi:hypothetical protein
MQDGGACSAGIGASPLPTHGSKRGGADDTLWRRDQCRQTAIPVRLRDRRPRLRVLERIPPTARWPRRRASRPHSRQCGRRRTAASATGHANTVKLIQHFINGSPAPTQALRVTMRDGGTAVDEIYLNAGDEISAGSVGVTFGNKLLIGSITDRQILVWRVLTLP